MSNNNVPVIKGNDAVGAYKDEVADHIELFGDVHVVLNFQGEIPVTVYCSQVFQCSMTSLINCCVAHLATRRGLKLTLNNASLLEQEVWDELEFVLNPRYRSPILQFMKDGITFRMMPCESWLPRVNRLVMEDVMV